MEVPDVAAVDAGEIDRKSCCKKLGWLDERIRIGSVQRRSWLVARRLMVRTTVSIEWSADQGQLRVCGRAHSLRRVVFLSSLFTMSINCCRCSSISSSCECSISSIFCRMPCMFPLPDSILTPYAQPISRWRIASLLRAPMSSNQ